MQGKNVMEARPEPPKEPAFICPICMDTLVEPSSTICGHIFCCSCIKASVKSQKKCPTCQRKLSMSNFHRVYLPTTTDWGDCRIAFFLPLYFEASPLLWLIFISLLSLSLSHWHYRCSWLFLSGSLAIIIKVNVCVVAQYLSSMSQIERKWSNKD